MVYTLNHLGLFPDLTEHAVGGIQFSGRLAWEAIRQRSAQQSQQARLFCFGRQPASRQPDPEIAFHVTSKMQAIRTAVSRRWQADNVLIWHIALLRLLPFFRIPATNVRLFLHGIEIWRRHDPLTRLLLPRVNCFLSNSQYTWQRFLKYYPQLAGKAHQTVHLGVARPGKQILVPEKPPAALILSRLARSEDYKGHRELIDAWPLLLQRIPDARLWIAGDGDLRPDLERQVAARGLAQHIHFFGRVTEEQKQDLLARCHCFVMPSRGEGFGLVYLEAMRLGRPCLVSDCDAGREVINPPEGGLAVDPDNQNTLVAALLRLLKSGSEWEHWSIQTQQRYERQFTAQHFQCRLLEAFDL
jgi:phosphatidylinositol alpha-1,6-mannosyltransferase